MQIYYEMRKPISSDAERNQKINISSDDQQSISRNCIGHKIVQCFYVSSMILIIYIVTLRFGEVVKDHVVYLVYDNVIYVLGLHTIFRNQIAQVIEYLVLAICTHTEFHFRVMHNARGTYTTDHTGRDQRGIKVAFPEKVLSTTFLMSVHLSHHQFRRVG